MNLIDRSDDNLESPPRPAARRWALLGDWVLRGLEISGKLFGLVLCLGLGGLFLWMLFFADGGNGGGSLPPKDPTRDWVRDLDQRIEREAKQWPEKEKHLLEAQKRLMKKIEQPRKEIRIH